MTASERIREARYAREIGEVEVGTTYDTIYGDRATILGGCEGYPDYVTVSVKCPWGGSDRVLPTRLCNLRVFHDGRQVPARFTA